MDSSFRSHQITVQKYRSSEVLVLLILRVQITAQLPDADGIIAEHQFEFWYDTLFLQ
jgi:hypothetical protein